MTLSNYGAERSSTTINVMGPVKRASKLRALSRA